MANRKRFKTIYDGNHDMIVRALREAGIDVIDTANKSNGHPDLMCSFECVTCYAEVKTGDNGLTPTQEKWRQKKGKVIGKDYFILRNFDDVNQLVRELTNAAGERQNQSFTGDERTPRYMAGIRTV